MINWTTLNQPEQLDALIEESKTAPVLIFKHSTSCSISQTVKSRLERQWSDKNASTKTYYLDLIAFRSISNEIASRFGVRHESPQVLLISNGDCTYHASHLGINAQQLESQLAS